MSQELVLNNLKDTENLAKQIAEQLTPGGGIIALTGNLGTGKTTFSQFLIKHLGVTSRVLSPTFVLMREYTANNRQIYHLDLYRLEKNQLSELDLADLISESNTIIIIEWAEKAIKPLPKSTLVFKFSIDNQGQRLVEINKNLN